MCGANAAVQPVSHLPPPLVHDRLVCHWVVGAASDVEVYLWGFDLLRRSVEPIGTFGQFPKWRAIKMVRSAEDGVV